MLDLIKTQVEAGQVMEIVQAFDVRDEVVVKIKLDQVLRDFWREGDSVDLILTETYSLDLRKPFQMQCGDGAYATVYKIDLLNHR